jgi:hypothetical protein
MVITKQVNSITFENDYLILTVNSKVYNILISDVSQKLNSANEIERNFFKISPSGYGIHWPLIDEDLSIDSLISISKN